MDTTALIRAQDQTTRAFSHVAARNIAAQVRAEVPTEEKAFADIKAVCVLDAGNNGVIILADKMLPPRKHGVLIPGPQAHLMKLASRSTSSGRCATAMSPCRDPWLMWQLVPSSPTPSRST